MAAAIDLGVGYLLFPMMEEGRRGDGCDEVEGVVIVLGLDVTDVDTDFSAIRDGRLTLELHTPDIGITRD